ncbi:hypothetical protein FB451DRAFT_1399656 [Mycena latifolia]|nr:hypothetical protein FB451DRAFT_1399656 [Mycena latifolia]
MVSLAFKIPAEDAKFCSDRSTWQANPKIAADRGAHGLTPLTLREPKPPGGGETAAIWSSSHKLGGSSPSQRETATLWLFGLQGVGKWQSDEKQREPISRRVLGAVEAVGIAEGRRRSQEDGDSKLRGSSSFAVPKWQSDKSLRDLVGCIEAGCGIELGSGRLVPCRTPTLALAILALRNRQQRGSSRARPYRQNKPRLANKLTAPPDTGAQQAHLRTTNSYAPPLATIISVAGILPFIIALRIVVSPLYWPSAEMGNHPPIANLSAYAAISTSAGSSLTRRKKLKVFRRWSSVFGSHRWCTRSYIKMGNMTSSYETSPWYWTGIAALVPQTYLLASRGASSATRTIRYSKSCISCRLRSNSGIWRHWSYYSASGIFMAALFIYVSFQLTSWDYFWATAAIYGLAWLSRVVRTLYVTGFGIPTTIECAGPDLIKLTIRAPAKFKWAPDQHVFVFARVLGLGVHALTSQPFTVSLLHESGAVELVLRATRVVLDGPYGGLHVPLAAYQRVYLLAGGTVQRSWSLFADLAAKLNANGASASSSSSQSLITYSVADPELQDRVLARIYLGLPPSWWKATSSIALEPFPGGGSSTDISRSGWSLSEGFRALVECVVVHVPIYDARECRINFKTDLSN